MNTLFLDFDGVICDSVDEAFYSSWSAYWQLQDSPAPHHIDLRTRQLFDIYRPLIQHGRDFLLLQEIIHTNRSAADHGATDRNATNRSAADHGATNRSATDHSAHSEQTFRRAQRAAGADQMQHYRTALYATRHTLLRTDRHTWLALHRIYPCFRKLLPLLAIRPNVSILSTKRADYIAALLRHWHIEWPAQRIITVSDGTKIDTIATRLAAHEQALFIDDHIDHLLARADARYPAIRCCLANWGYVLPQWLGNRRYEQLAADQLETALQDWIHPPPPPR